MRMPAILLLSSVSVFAAGCSVDVLHYGAKNLLYAPCNRANGAKECVKANALAEQSWQQFQGCNSGIRYSKDFADGYVFGFADYIEKGGAGIPPVVPPLHYRKVRYETPEGHQQIADWFAGCRAGIAAGMASGYREYVILPMSVPPPKPAYTNYGMPETMPGAEAEPLLPAPTPDGFSVPPAPVPVPAPAPAPAPAPGLNPATAFAPAPAPSLAPATASVPAPGPARAPSAPAPTLAPAGLPMLPPPAAQQIVPAPGLPRGIGPHAAIWPSSAPTFRTTPPPPVRTTVPPPWQDGRPATAPAPAATDVAIDAQRLAAAFPPAPTAADKRLLGDPSPVDAGVWMSARDVGRRESGPLKTSSAEPKAIAVGQLAKPPPSSLRSESPPPPDPTDDPSITVSHRGARWQN